MMDSEEVVFVVFLLVVAAFIAVIGVGIIDNKNGWNRYCALAFEVSETAADTLNVVREHEQCLERMEKTP